MSRYGVIYIAHNPAYGENIYKIGKTERDVKSRLRELNSETTNIGEFKELAYFVVLNIDEAELICHQALSEFRIQSNREFFQGDLDKVILKIKKALVPYIAESKIPSNNKPLINNGLKCKGEFKCENCGSIRTRTYFGDEPPKFNCGGCHVTLKLHRWDKV